MHDMSLTEIYFCIGLMWSFVEIGVAVKELAAKRASKSLNFTASAWRQAQIDRFYAGYCKYDVHIFTKCVAALVGFIISSAITITAWPVSVFMFVRNRT